MYISKCKHVYTMRLIWNRIMRTRVARIEHDTLVFSHMFPISNTLVISELSNANKTLTLDQLSSVFQKPPSPISPAIFSLKRATRMNTFCLILARLGLLCSEVKDGETCQVSQSTRVSPPFKIDHDPTLLSLIDDFYQRADKRVARESVRSSQS